MPDFARSPRREVTRESYREAVEPICKANTKANERILTGVQAEVTANKLKPAAPRQFAKAATALKKTLAPARPRCRARRPTRRSSTKWLGYVKDRGLALRSGSPPAAGGQEGSAERDVVKLTSIANSPTTSGHPLRIRLLPLRTLAVHLIPAWTEARPPSLSVAGRRRTRCATASTLTMPASSSIS